MAEIKTDDAAPVVTSAPVRETSFFRRELNGATFLSLEHVLHMALVVVLAGVLSGGVALAVSLWTSTAGVSGVALDFLGTNAMMQMLQSMHAIMVVAALVVLVPLLVVLDRRTRAEWLKRPGYANRLAYKVPVYTAIGLLVAGKVVADIIMVGVVLTSLSMLGTANADIGSLYLQDFLPALLMAVIFGSAAWYVFKLAKGRDMGQMFSTMVAVVGLAVAIALFVTAVVDLHSKTNTFTPSTMPYTNPFQNGGSGSGSSNIENLFNY